MGLDRIVDAAEVSWTASLAYPSPCMVISQNEGATLDHQEHLVLVIGPAAAS